MLLVKMPDGGSASSLVTVDCSASEATKISEPLCITAPSLPAKLSTDTSHNFVGIAIEGSITSRAGREHYVGERVESQSAVQMSGSSTACEREQRFEQKGMYGNALRDTVCSGGEAESVKRKREDVPEEGPCDPLFVAKRPGRQPKEKLAKKANIIVKTTREQSDATNGSRKSNGADDELKQVDCTARGYQIEIVREAQKRNTIAYLETGCGKTLIAVLLMRSMAHRLRIPDRKRIAIFLVPTVALVYQQASVIDYHTDFIFGKYAGHMNVDSWKPEKWQEEIDKHEILVMTPQILVDIMTHGILKMDIVELLIFDECHHTDGRHPYNRIMNKYRDTPVGSRPHILGMTASPVSGKGLASGDRANEQLSRLEQKLDAKVYAVKDRTELEAFVPTPKTIEQEYDPPIVPMDYHVAKLEEIAKKYFVYEETPCGEVFKDYEDLNKKLQKTIKKLCNALAYCLGSLGYLCAIKAAELLVKEDVKDHYYAEANLHVQAAMRAAKDRFLREALEYLRSTAPAGALPSDSQEIALKHVTEGSVTPKVKLLLDVLMSYKDVSHVRCIVFVNRVVASLVVANFINQLPCLSFLKCTYLAGVNSSRDTMDRKLQQAAVEDFRAGVYNLLVATNVAEEGIDVQGCHSVIRFDPCTGVRSHIQSRGRARRPGSDYVVFMEKGNIMEKENFNTIVKSETKMAESALDRPEESPPELPAEPDLESFRVEATGACLTTDLSVAFLQRFCARLPGDKYYLPRPEFSYRLESGEMHVCIVALPPNSPIGGLTGSPRKNVVIAKQVACLEICKRLYEIGALTDHLIPVADISAVDEVEGKRTASKKRAGVGTTKRKELHDTFITSQLEGSWTADVDGASLYVSQIIFSSENAAEGHYENFALLTEAQLDDHVAHLEVELVLRLEQIVAAKLGPAGKVHLSRNQLADAKQYQELVFNGLFGKLLTRASKVPGSVMTRRALVTENSETLWSSRRTYLLLPLHADVVDSGNRIPTECQIDWKSISETATTARMFRSIYANANGDPSLGEVAQDCDQTIHLRTDGEELQMAFGSHVKASEIVGKVVLTVHTGMIYVITEIHDKTAKAPFPTTQDGKDKGKGSKFSSYEEYFTQQHKHPLKYPDQPLLNAKQTHRPRNLLARNVVKRSMPTKAKSRADQMLPCTVDIPPELCVILGFSSAAVRSAYLLPSVLHRFDAALVASDLRRRIEMEQPDCPTIKNSTVVEALTTLRCLEEFSFEGLELLGDSFLKYSQSRYLFLEFDRSHEGQLSAKRSKQICNANLHQLAMSRGLPTFIRDEVFDPSRWVAPGMYLPKELYCRCNLKDLCNSAHDSGICDGKEGNETKSSEIKVVRIGKSCGKGHRWLCSKTVSDVVEALIGAYFVDGDINGALSFMRWAGFLVDVDEETIERARARANLNEEVNVGADLQKLESILNYSFTNKGLLVEALTHASYHDFQGYSCYQRLEFLGDAVLDLLVTKHLFFSYPGLTPGHLTDLRSAAVNNECFARVAAKHKLNKYLRHGSGFLLKQIQEFLEKYDSNSDDEKRTFGWDGVKGPKVLGDLVESIAGAILVDSCFNLEVVWQVMKPLLSPIITPETLPLHPVRELHELCHLKGFTMELDVTQKKEMSEILMTVDLGNDSQLAVTSSDSQRKACHKVAAQEMLALLETIGIRHPYKLTGRVKAQRGSEAHLSQLSSLEIPSKDVPMIPQANCLEYSVSSTKRKVQDQNHVTSSDGDDLLEKASKKAKLSQESMIQVEPYGSIRCHFACGGPLQEGKISCSMDSVERVHLESGRLAFGTASLLTVEHEELEMENKTILAPA